MSRRVVMCCLLTLCLLFLLSLLISGTPDLGDLFSFSVSQGDSIRFLKVVRCQPTSQDFERDMVRQMVREAIKSDEFAVIDGEKNTHLKVHIWDLITDPEGEGGDGDFVSALLWLIKMTLILGVVSKIISCMAKGGASAQDGSLLGSDDWDGSEGL